MTGKDRHIEKKIKIEKQQREKKIENKDTYKAEIERKKDI